MEKEQFGSFVSQVRKERNMTQKELGEKLNITDKAISKWERGLSYPDICMLESLAEALDVTIVELLNGKKNEEGNKLSVSEVERLIDYSLEISDAEIEKKREKSKMVIAFCVILIMLFISIIINIINYAKLQERDKKLNESERNKVVYEVGVESGSADGCIPVLYVGNDQVKTDSENAEISREGEENEQ